jgi:hypothetical protein
MLIFWRLVLFHLRNRNLQLSKEKYHMSPIKIIEVLIRQNQPKKLNTIVLVITNCFRFLKPHKVSWDLRFSFKTEIINHNLIFTVDYQPSNYLSRKKISKKWQFKWYIGCCPSWKRIGDLLFLNNSSIIHL